MGFRHHTATRCFFGTCVAPTHSHTHGHTLIHTHIHTHSNTHAHTRIHTHAHTDTYNTHTHTHTHTCGEFHSWDATFNGCDVVTSPLTAPDGTLLAARRAVLERVFTSIEPTSTAKTRPQAVKLTQATGFCSLLLEVDCKNRYKPFLISTAKLNVKRLLKCLVHLQLFLFVVDCNFFCSLLQNF